MMVEKLTNIKIDGSKIGAKLQEFDENNGSGYFYVFYECSTMQDVIYNFIAYMHGHCIKFRDWNTIPEEKESFNYTIGSYSCSYEEGFVKWSIHFNSRTLKIIERREI